VHFPLGLRRYRCDAELTPWEACVAQHGLYLRSPTDTKGRHRLHKQVAPRLRQAPACRARHEPFRTKIAQAMALVEEAMRCQVPVGGVVVAAWYLAEDVVRVWARRRKGWSHRLTKNRRLETASLPLRAAHGWTLQRPGPPIAVQALVPLIPAQTYRLIAVREQTSWCFTVAAHLPGLGQVRIVVHLEPESVTGRSVVLVTNRVNWTAAKIIGLYWHRWPTEIVSTHRTK
jgi:hypothetical protein